MAAHPSQASVVHVNTRWTSLLRPCSPHVETSAPAPGEICLKFRPSSKALAVRNRRPLTRTLWTWCGLSWKFVMRSFTTNSKRSPAGRTLGGLSDRDRCQPKLPHYFFVNVASCQLAVLCITQ